MRNNKIRKTIGTQIKPNDKNQRNPHFHSTTLLKIKITSVNGDIRRENHIENDLGYKNHIK